MASITRESNGRKTIQFIAPDGKRRSLRLGKCSMRTAETVKVRVEAIVSALKGGAPLDDETATWLGKRDAAMLDKLAAVGLAEARVSTTLKAFLDHYDSIRHVKPATHVVWGHTRRNLVGYFGESKSLNAITEADAEQWREHLVAVEKLSEATIRKRCKFARQFFGFAVKKRLVASNPFAGLKAGNLANRARDRFISREDAQAVIDACPDAEWRLLFALSRYGGLRCPSEHLSLRWDDIDWHGARIRVRSPKTEHHPGHESRSIPLFPELLPYLRDAAELAPEGGRVGHRQATGLSDQSPNHDDEDHPAGQLGAVAEIVPQFAGDAADGARGIVPFARGLCLARQQPRRGKAALPASD